MDNDNREKQCDQLSDSPCSEEPGLQGPTDTGGAEYIVRRLTPTECARLQGFPDDWATKDIAIPDPNEQTFSFWRQAFDRWAEVNGTKPKSDKQILKWLSDPHSDSEEYKLWGNGIALPCLLPMMKAMHDILEAESQ